jgi:uncharacterized protein YbcI
VGAPINAEIARSIVHCYREHAGRGPTKAQAFYHHDVVVVVMHGWMTPEERSLARVGAPSAARQIREALNEAVRERLVACIEAVIDGRVLTMMTSDDPELDSASCVFLLDRPVTPSRSASKPPAREGSASRAPGGSSRSRSR